MSLWGVERKNVIKLTALSLLRHGEPHRDFSAIIGWKALSDSITELGEQHEFTKLVVDLKGKDPNDAFSSVPYEKGSTFLYHLEKLLGREKWDSFIPYVRFFLPTRSSQSSPNIVLPKIRPQIPRLF